MKTVSVGVIWEQECKNESPGRYCMLSAINKHGPAIYMLSKSISGRLKLAVFTNEILIRCKYKTAYVTTKTHVSADLQKYWTDFLPTEVVITSKIKCAWLNIWNIWLI